MDLECLASIERELTTRHICLHPEQFRRRPETRSPSGVVVTGYGGHLFIADGGNRWEQQLIGNVRLSPDDVGCWLSLLTNRAEKARNLGVQLVHLVVPDKQVSLSSYRWTDVVPDLSRRPLTQIQAVAPADSQIIYPAEAFALHQPWCELYWRGNSHWCASGCIIAARLAALSLLKDDVFTVDRIPLEKAVIRQDLTAHFPDDMAFEEVIRIRPTGTRIYDNGAFQQTGHYTGSHFVMRNLYSPIKESLVIFGDSFACDSGLTAALSAFFTNVHFVWSKDIVWTYVEQVKAKYVLWESAERFLIVPPKDGNGVG